MTGDRGARGLRRPFQPQRGTAVFAGGTSVAVVFAHPYQTADYVLTLAPSLDTSDGGVPLVAWSNKTGQGFTLTTAAAFTGSVDWSCRGKTQ